MEAVGVAVLRWFTQTLWVGAFVDSGAGEQVTTFSFNNSNFFDGSSLERILVSYRFQTDIEDNSSGVQKQPLPLAVAVWFTPNPQDPTDPSSETVDEAMQGDALFTDMARWHQNQWTDGTLFGTQWVADSGGIQSQQGKRTIVDKATALLHIGVNSAKDLFGGDEVNSIDVAYCGNIYVKMLCKAL